jgi:hypothetical protein
MAHQLDERRMLGSYVDHPLVTELMWPMSASALLFAVHRSFSVRSSLALAQRVDDAQQAIS